MKNKKEEIRFETGCKLLDMLVGGNKDTFGFPAGRFINIVGDKSAGKTFLSNEIIASAYYKYGNKKFKWVYDDCESGYSFDTESMYGFEIMPQNDEDRTHSETVEQCFCNIKTFADKLDEGQFGIYVIDSLDGLTSSEQNERAEERMKAFKQDKTFDKGTYGMGKQKYLSQEFFPQLCSTIENKNVLVIIISQIRDNVDMFSFEKFTRSGGKSMDFYAHTVLWLATAKKNIKKNIPIGVCVKAKTTKSKTPRPYRECFFNLVYDYGLDDIGTSVDYLFDLRTEKGELKSIAKAVRWKDGEKIGVNPLKSWLKEENILDEYLDSKYCDGKVAVEDVLDWVNSDKKIKEKFENKFGVSMTRDELISWIEDNDKQQELNERVVAKWEEIEDSVKTIRKKKYATQLIGSDS